METIIRRTQLPKRYKIFHVADKKAIRHLPFIKGGCSKGINYIYFLLNDDEIVYIGLTHDIHQRLLAHWEKEYNGVVVRYINNKEFAQEAKYIKQYWPKYNLASNDGSRPSYRNPYHPDAEIILYNEIRHAKQMWLQTDNAVYQRRYYNFERQLEQWKRLNKEWKRMKKERLLAERT